MRKKGQSGKGLGVPLPTLGRGQEKVPEGGRVKLYKQPAREPLTKSLRFEVMRRDGFRCRLCGAIAADGAKLEVDHIVPVSRGGTNDPHNLQTLCEACNRGKSNRLF